MFNSLEPATTSNNRERKKKNDFFFFFFYRGSTILFFIRETYLIKKDDLLLGFNSDTGGRIIGFFSFLKILLVIDAICDVSLGGEM